MKMFLKAFLITSASLGIVGLFYFIFQYNEPKITKLSLGECNLFQSECSANLPNGGVLKILLTPKPVPLRDPFTVEVRLENYLADRVLIDFKGLTEETGFKRPELKKDAAGIFTVSTDLVHCDDPAMSWQVSVLLQKNGDTLVVPFHLIGRGSSAPKFSKISEKPHGGDFILDTASGPIDSRKMRGKYVFIYFGYTSCPDICPTSLSDLSAALNKLSVSELKKVVAVFVSLDPKRDTLAYLKKYTKFFNKKIIGATSTDENLKNIVRLFGASYKINVPEGGKDFYTVDHTGDTYLINPNGDLIDVYTYGTRGDEIVKRFREKIKK